MQTISTIILAILAVVSVGGLIAGYIAWRHRRRTDDAVQALKLRETGGGGGPQEPP